MHGESTNCPLAGTLRLLEYDLSPEVVAFSTERNLPFNEASVGFGDKSTKSYASFNISHLYGDTPEHVSESYEKLCSTLGVDREHILQPIQVHGKEVAVIGDDWWRISEEQRARRISNVDAVITRQRGLCIGVSTADCVPVLVYDPCGKTVAAIHAGWRGVVAGVVASSFDVLRRVSEFQAGQVRAAIGPSISRTAFEVGDEVYEAFRGAGFSMPDIACRIHGKWHIDLWAATCLQLLEEGMALHNIQVSGICTYEQEERFFSARRLGLHSGRIYNGIMIRP